LAALAAGQVGQPHLSMAVPVALPGHRCRWQAAHRHQKRARLVLPMASAVAAVLGLLGQAARLVALVERVAVVVAGLGLMSPTRPAVQVAQVASVTWK